MSLPKLPSASRPSLIKYDEQVDTLAKHSFFQDGRCYVLSNSNIPHQLPAPSKLHPYVDQKPGHMVTWPAHSNNVAAVNFDNVSSSKPKFLLKLENYLDKELTVLQCKDTTQSCEKRLQVFREVFQFLIDDFRTYKPLLSAIKNEYESFLLVQKNTIQDLEPLKAMVVNISDQCEQKVLNLKLGEKLELRNLQNENDNLQNTISSLKEEITSNQNQIKKCQDRIAVEYQKYRDESDARKLLIQDLNDIRYQQDESKQELSAGDEENHEDNVMLRIALKKARQDLDTKTFRLAEVMADYGDVVPRRDYEKLEMKFKALEDMHGLLNKDYQQISSEHSSLLDVHKKVIEQRDNFALDCQRLRRSATPRPDWAKCALYVEGGSDRWNEISHEKSTNDKVNILLAEMTGQDISIIKAGSVIVDFFEPKGSGDEVPVYLRADEQVKNRRLTKRDLCLTIKDIWYEKNQKEGGQPFTQHSNLAEFFYEYLQQRLPLPGMVTEWAYNIHDAINRYNFDSYVGLFGNILNGEVDEDVYYCQMKQLEDLYRLFQDVDPEDSGCLNKENFSGCLHEYFSYHTTDDIIKLVKAAEDELEGFHTVSYKDLFTEDDEGKSGPFITSLQELNKQDKLKYLAEIENCFETKSDVTTDDLREALLIVNPKIKPDICDQYISFGFRKADQVAIPKHELMKNLHRSCIRRT